MYHSHLALGSFKIVVVKPQPRMLLAANVPVTQEVRDRENAWLAEFFGYHYVMKKGSVLTDKVNMVMYIREDDYPALKSIAKIPVYS
jgi:hypothetical protein